MHARIFFASVSKILCCNRFLISESKFCVFWYRKQILVLISSCMRQRKIRFRYDTTSWFTDSPIASAMSCPQMPTTELLPHNAPRSVVTPQGLDRTEVARGGACTYLCVCFMYVRVCLNVDFDATAWTKRIHDVLVSPGTSYFLGPLIRIVSPVKSWIPRECTYIKIFAFARRVCKWAISVVYYNWYQSSRARRVNRDRNFSLEILYLNVFP